MNENFRLLEYKRKQYIKKQKSNSPQRAASQLNDQALPSPQRNFLTSIYGSGNQNGK